MKYAFIFFFILLFGTTIIAQNINYNQGETTPKGYFSIIKFESIAGFIVVKATIQGETYRFMLDTGSPNSITKTLYDKIKPPILSEEKMGDGNGTLNHAKTKIVNIQEWTFGDIVFNNIPTAVLDNFIVFECMQIDGFIGSNMLKNSIIQISETDKTIILTDDTSRLRLSEKFASDIEFLDVQNSPYIEILLSGETAGSNWSQFDTGFQGFYNLSTLAYDSIFSKYPILKLKTTGYGGNSISLWGFNEANLHKLIVPELILNNAVFRNVSMITSSSDNSRIGNDLLKYGKVTVDYINKKFYFEPHKMSIDLDEKEFPISLKFEGNKLLIGTIWGEKYAQLLQIGDQILSIDGVNCETINPCDWLLNGSSLDNKEKAKLLIKTKGGRIVNIEMERE